jgi:hypothetical protein
MNCFDEFFDGFFLVTEFVILGENLPLYDEMVTPMKGFKKNLDPFHNHF